MKAIDVLYCLNYMGTNNESWQILDVPPTGGVMIPQTREWWNAMIGAVPERMQPSGKYFLLYPDDDRSGLFTGSEGFEPDDVIRVNDGESVIYLYRLED